MLRKCGPRAIPGSHTAWGFRFCLGGAVSPKDRRLREISAALGAQGGLLTPLGVSHLVPRASTRKSDLASARTLRAVTPTRFSAGVRCRFPFWLGIVHLEAHPKVFRLHDCAELSKPPVRRSASCGQRRDSPETPLVSTPQLAWITPPLPAAPSRSWAAR